MRHEAHPIRYVETVTVRARLGAALERFLLPLVLASAVLGGTVPGPARWVVEHDGITTALTVLVFAVGLGLPVTELTRTRAYSLRIVVVVVVPVVVLPALAWAASRLVSPGPLRDGVISAGVAPTEVAAVALAALAGGSAALAATVLIGSTLATILLAAPTLNLLTTTPTGSSTGSLLITLFEVVALPLAVGIIIRAAIPGRHGPAVDTVSSGGTALAVLVLIWLVASQAHLGVAYLQVGLALLLFLVASTLTGALLTRGLPAPVRTSLLLPVAMRDFAIAAGIAAHTFGPPAAAPLALYGVLVLILGAASQRLSSSPRPV